MAEIYGTNVSDEVFMLSMELGTLLNSEKDYLDDKNEIDISKIKNPRAVEILKKLETLSGK